MKTYLLLAVLLLTSSGLLAQKAAQRGDMTVHIMDDDNWDQTNFIDVSKKSGKAIISSPKMIKLRREELSRDTGFLELRKNGSKHPITEYKEKLKGFFDHYSTFDTTIVIIDLKTDSQYNDILKLIATSSKAKLEKSHEIRDMVMDASNYTFTISTDTNTKNVYAKGLFDERYPVLANFLKLTYARLESVKQK
ncbi:MAG: hypothetical protein V4560_00880 [Bacteroidota bacterium]